MNNEHNNFNENQETPQIIGFDQLTGQPIFNSGIESKNNEKINEKHYVEQKKISKIKFLFHISLSFWAWNLVAIFLLNNLIAGVIYNLFKNNIIIYLTMFNLIWIGTSVLQIFLTYWFNKFKTVEEYQLRSVKNINLIMFFISIIFVNSSIIKTMVNNYTILGSIFIVLHMVIIWLMNEKIFDRYWGVDHF